MKDRHSKVRTAKGLRDRRVRLSAPTAVQFFDIQDRLGYEQPSKAVDWLLENASAAINQLRSGGTAAADSSRPPPDHSLPPFPTCPDDRSYPVPAAAPSEPPPPTSAAALLRRHSDIETPDSRAASDLSANSKQLSAPAADRPKRRLSSSWRNPVPAPAQRRGSVDRRHGDAAYGRMQQPQREPPHRQPSESSTSADHEHDDAGSPAYPKFPVEFERHHWELAPGISNVGLMNPVVQSTDAREEQLPLDGTRRAKARERARERVMKERSAAAVPDGRLRQSGATFNGRKLPTTTAGDSSAADRSAAAAAAMIVNRATDHGYQQQQYLIRQQQAQLMDHYGPRPDPILTDHHHRFPEYDAAADLQIHGGVLSAGAAASAVVHSSARLQPSSAPNSIYSSAADEILRQYNLHQATSSLNLMRRKPILQAGIMEQQSGAGNDRQDHHSGADAMNLCGNASGDDAAAYHQHYAMNLYPPGAASNLVGSSTTFLQDQHYNSSANPFAASSIASPQFYRQQNQQQLNGGGAASSSPARGTLQSMNFINANYNVSYNYTGQAQSSNLLQQYINYQQQAQLVDAAANQAAGAGVSDDERRRRRQINLQDMLADMDPPAAAVINLNQTSHYATAQYTHLNAAAFSHAGGEASGSRYAAKNEAEEENDRKQAKEAADQ